ncbi:hypothetical protein BHE74_00020878 [Ensete ventricosum]|nr:hypothetical protein GW17_00024792 [Ensete ventricosum]RWW71400.1 hypothetical protein BHE74_00020878 [Ensete ventricosum]RZR83492.1 hypothetical protein BHM03_00010102 [Ensete ventricosum]
MALSVLFALSALLLLGLDEISVRPASAVAADVVEVSDDKPHISRSVMITYGSVIKLMHERTKYRLHSHDVPYGSGSGQQSVTGSPEVDDSNSYWVRL